MTPDPVASVAGAGDAPANEGNPPRKGLSRWLPRRLAPRLILGTTLLVVAGHLVSTYLVVGLLERRWLEAKALSADQLSRSITTATRHLMMAARKDDAYALMRTIADAQGVPRIRIYSRTGRVAFRTDPGEEKEIAISAPSCQVCHATDPPRDRATALERSRIVRGEDDLHELSIVTPIRNEPGCSTAECHAHESSARVLGILDLTLDLRPVDAEIARLRGPVFLLAAIGILLVAGFLNFVIHRTVARPVHRMVMGTRAVARMELGSPIPGGGAQEFEELAHAFNLMQARLKEALDLNARTLAELEERVEHRSRELQATRERLVESDRLASLGKLAASVAHEVNNPISAVLNLSMFLQRILTDEGVPPERLAAFRRHLQQISEETARAGRIVTDLLAFSRKATPRRSPSDLNVVVQKSVDLVRHRVTLSRVDLVLELDPGLPAVPCDAGQIEQVLVNLVINAAEALKEGGRIVVRSGREPLTDSAVLQVEDDGPGIPEAILARIFDPFFSTKSEAKGVGLGLSVAYGITEAHGGRLSVESEPGKRTVFTVRLPMHPKPGAAEATP